MENSDRGWGLFNGTWGNERFWLVLSKMTTIFQENDDFFFQNTYVEFNENGKRMEVNERNRGKKDVSEEIEDG